MSFLQRQINSFNSSAVAAAKHMPTSARQPLKDRARERSATPGACSTQQQATQQQATTATGSPAASAASASAASRARARPRQTESPAPSASTVDSASASNNRMVQVAFAIEHLKKRAAPLTFVDVASYLSLEQQGYDAQHLRIIERILQTHPKITYDPHGAGGEGTLAFKPPHNIRSADDLLAALHKQPTGNGLSVAALREGWPDAVTEINRLEKEGRLLVTRNKKEDFPKMVWPNDPTLIAYFDPEFKAIWEKVKIPDAETVVEELEKAGITPTNKSKVVKAKPTMERKKTKRTRRGGKVTNTHMAGVLRDYSHLQP